MDQLGNPQVGPAGLVGGRRIGNGQGQGNAVLAFGDLFFNGADAAFNVQGAPDHCGLDDFQLVGGVIKGVTGILWIQV